ncbi:MAG: hypothetical protein JWP61_2488 [Friedmanniella sp.]|nr:hypothetical protein [Friedmanniella sp.]
MELTRTSPAGEPVAVIGCQGRLNMLAAPALRSFIEETLGEGHEKIVVELSGTSFIDSSGLAALIGGLKAARQSGGDLRIAAPSDQVRSVLRLTNLDRVLLPHAQVSDATDGW